MADAMADAVAVCGGILCATLSYIAEICQSRSISQETTSLLRMRVCVCVCAFFAASTH